MNIKDMETERLIIRSTHEEDGAFCLSMWLDDDMGKYMEDPLVVYEDGRRWDFGYSVHKKFWRQRYGTEMIKAMIDYGYRHGGRVFTADVAVENTASNAILKKPGFTVEKTGSFRKRFTDIAYDRYTYRLDME